MSEYFCSNKAPLKLKGGVIKKKKNKNKEVKKMADKLFQSESASNVRNDERNSNELEDSIHFTKAQLSFMKMQEKRQMERVMEKASKSHKQRVEEFNRKLDQITEHYDIPKVSWTK